ncbi:interleukin-11 receptor subunit alpha isoform X2 [Latimeria chalumnae]
MSYCASCLGRVLYILTVSLICALVPTDTQGDEDLQYGRIGTDITLTCRSSSSSVAEWRINGTPVISSGSLTQDGSLVLPNVSTDAHGNYSCHDASGRLLSSTSLQLGHAPGKPSVRCRATNYYNFSCFWELSREPFLPTKYIATYSFRDPVLRGGICLQDPSRRNTCTIQRPSFWNTYFINITAVNPLGSDFRLLRIIMSDIVKPDPPEGLKVEPVPGSPRRLHVRWKYPSSWPKENHFQLKFQLQYRPLARSSWSVVETTNLEETITDAFSGSLHMVQVGAKDFLDAGNWSEWSPVAMATPWTEPTPETANETILIQTEVQRMGPVHSPTSVPKGLTDHYERVGLFLALGIFAVLLLAVAGFIVIFVWIKKRGKEEEEKRELTFLFNMKTSSKAQIH